MPKTHRNGLVSDGAYGRLLPGARVAAVAATDAARVQAEAAQRRVEAARTWLRTGLDEVNWRIVDGERVAPSVFPGTVVAVEAAAVRNGVLLADVRTAIAEAVASGTLIRGGSQAAPTLARRN